MENHGKLLSWNYQRKNICHRVKFKFVERAFAFKMKLEAMKRQVGRHPRNGGQVGHHFNGKKSRELMAEKVFS